MLNEERAKEEHAQENVKGDDSVELWNYCNPGTQQVILKQFRLKEILQGENKEFWAAEKQICEQKSWTEIVECGSERGSDQEVEYWWEVNKSAHKKEADRSKEVRDLMYVHYS